MSRREKILATTVQRSHNLYVLSNAAPGRDGDFLTWLQGEQLQSVSALNKVLSAQNFVQHEKDISGGVSKRLGFKYLSVYELTLDGAEQASGVIEPIRQLHDSEASAGEVVTWLYYPASEKVGHDPENQLDFLVLAFGNAVSGKEALFREWYSTEHMRHALILPTMVSGQYFELSAYQQPTTSDPGYATLTVYEQEGTLDELLQGFTQLEEGDIGGSDTFDIDRFFRVGILSCNGVCIQ